MKLAVALILVAASVSPGQAPVPVAPDGHVEQLAMGEYWMGVDVTAKDLVGKVVLLEYWGS